MAHFHIDADVNPRLQTELAVFNHVAVVPREMRMLHASDGAHLLMAAQQRRILVTRNRKDFLLLHGAWLRWALAWQVTQQHAGILIIAAAWTLEHAAREIAALVGQRATLSDELHAWEPPGRWVRHP